MVDARGASDVRHDGREVTGAHTDVEEAQAVAELERVDDCAVDVRCAHVQVAVLDRLVKIRLTAPLGRSEESAVDRTEGLMAEGNARRWEESSQLSRNNSRLGGGLSTACRDGRSSSGGYGHALARV